MCISANPAELNQTVIANFPQQGKDEQHRVLSYMNTVKSIPGGRTTDPNAMIFPVYGEVTDLLDCPDPRASRAWLEAQTGVYQEAWYDQTVVRASTSEPARTHVLGNYLVGVAGGVEDIPGVLEDMRRGPKPEHVPTVPDTTLESMDRFYRAQGLGIPQFVIAAFLLPPKHHDDKNPITLTYNQWDAMADKMVFPALDYHGYGAFDKHVKRDHKLLFSSKVLQEALQPVMIPSHLATPAEFAGAPGEFPMYVGDSRDRRTHDAAQRAPNNDYIFDMQPIHAKLQGVDTELRAIAADHPEVTTSRFMRDGLANPVLAQRMGKCGIMQHSNQPSTTAEAFYGPHEDSDTLYVVGADDV